jgi:hypothetical protein
MAYYCFEEKVCCIAISGHFVACIATQKATLWEIYSASLRRFGSGNNGISIAHCSSLNKTGRFFIEEAHHQPALSKSHTFEAVSIYATSSRKIKRQTIPLTSG